MIDLRFRPLTRWIGEKTPARDRKRASFATPYVKVLDRLEKELRHLNASNTIVEAAFHIRNDGWPYAAYTPSEPGVILSFDSKYGPLALPCDYFIEWTKNLHAITLHLEHLRLATIYGVGAGGEQYKGWKALAAPGGENSLEHFAGVVVELARGGYSVAEVVRDYDTFRHAYRTAVANTHPDKPDSNWQNWHKLQEAVRMLDQAFKGKGAAS